MPAPRAVLDDVERLGLKHNRGHKSIGGHGRLRIYETKVKKDEVVVKSVAAPIKPVQPVIVVEEPKKVEVVLPVVVESEPAVVLEPEVVVLAPEEPVLVVEEPKVSTSDEPEKKGRRKKVVVDEKSTD